MTAGLSLGAPGVYRAPGPPPPAGVAQIRLDATGFVGISFRGPAQQPVPVSSWSQFVDAFGGVVELVDDEPVPCPGYLPRAVRAFFDQGGQVAWVCRVVPVHEDPTATARLELPGGRALVAANEGTWGRRLEVTMTFSSGPPLARDPGPAPRPGPDDELVIADVAALPPASLLVLGPSSTHPTGTLHQVTGQVVRPAAGGGRERVLTLDPPLPAPSRAPGAVIDARVVTATVTVLDRDPLRRRSEQVTGLGLHPDHPRYPARQLPPDHPDYPKRVLEAESRLVRTADGWDEPILPADGALPPLVACPPHGGEDRFDEIDVTAFFDDERPDADPLDERDDHRGVDRVGRLEDPGLLCVPDLTWAGHAGHLDPGAAADALATIVERQRRLVAVADLRGRFVALLDVPSRLSGADVARWRSAFDSSYAAAYHPWLGVPGDGPGRRAVSVPPSAVAAGVIASRERRLGLPWGPANELAANVVTAADLVPDAVHDELHRLHVNVFRAEPGGFRLTSARSLSQDPRYRQLSVRRLMTMITLAVRREAEALVFEPNTAGLRAVVAHTLTEFLRDLHRHGAFAGDTEQQSFFVRCDEALNPPSSSALGRLVTEIGVAPSSPLEYLVLRISQDLDGTATVTPVIASTGGVR